uniref:Uncharacterized protein n=1 Tax=Rhodocyclus tenuis TaxID=1066 RepID=A0A840G6C3_RHOTE|nr:hypothetical protein [Rhodocyclus tenuis]
MQAARNDSADICSKCDSPTHIVVPGAKRLSQQRHRRKPRAVEVTGRLPADREVVVAR